MSQQKVDKYKQNKANRNKESKKEARSRRIEIGILIAVVCVGVVWFIVAGVSSSMSTKTETVQLNTSAIDNYVYDMQYGSYSSDESDSDDVVILGEDEDVEDDEIEVDATDFNVVGTDDSGNSDE